MPQTRKMAVPNKRRKLYNSPMHKNKINLEKVLEALNTTSRRAGIRSPPQRSGELILSECGARSADQSLRHADRLSTNSGGLKLSRFSEQKTDKTCCPTGAGYPLAKSSRPRAESKDLGEIRTPANEC